jgi:hypothetical protein
MTSVRERNRAARPFAVGADEANLDEAKMGHPGGDRCRAKQRGDVVSANAVKLAFARSQIETARSGLGFGLS